MQVAINRNMCLWGYYQIQGDPHNFNMYCLANSGLTELGNHNTGIVHNTGLDFSKQT